MRRLSYSNVVSTIALFAALGGGAVYAADKAGKRDIAKNAVRSNHIAKNQVKGADLLESSLGQVPEATHAASADSSQSAATSQSADDSQRVGGIEITPLSVARQENDDTSDYTVLASAANGAEVTEVRFRCDASDSKAFFIVFRDSDSAPQLTYRVVIEDAGVDELHQAHPDLGTFLGFDSEHLTATASIAETSGRITRLDVVGFYDQNAIGANDCFLEGTKQVFGS